MYYESTESHPHMMGFTDSSRKKAERVAALMNLEHSGVSYGIGLDMALEYAEEVVKGKSSYIFCTKEFEELVSNNQKFFEVLCEDGVVEWLTPLVLARGKNI
jgi:hypothetical protein